MVSLMMMNELPILLLMNLAVLGNWCSRVSGLMQDGESLSVSIEHVMYKALLQNLSEGSAFG